MSPRGLTALVLSCTMACLYGCESGPKGVAQTEGERTVMEGKLKQEQGKLLKEGEAQVAKGQGLRAEGEAMRQQGKTLEGDRKIRDAELMIKQGETKIEQARRMSTDVPMAAPGSSSSGSSTLMTSPRTSGSVTVDRDVAPATTTPPASDPALAPERERLLDQDVNKD